MNIELVSDASCLSDVGCNELGKNTKQVRFNVSSNQPQFADSFPQNILELSVQDESDLTNILPESPPSHLPVPSESLDLSVLDDFQIPNELEALTLDVPQINTVRNLQEEVIELASRIHLARNSRHSMNEAIKSVREKRQKESKVLGGDAYNICVNFSPNDRIFNDLQRLEDVKEDDLIRDERERLVRQRRRLLAEMAQSHSSKQEILPEPNLLKFFDPKRHIFQSARFDVLRISNLQPTIQSLSTPEDLEFVKSDYRLSTEPAYYL